MKIFDIITITLQSDKEQHPILIINIYNIKYTTQLKKLQIYLQKHLRNNTYNEIIMTGDFNLHHFLWNSSNYPIQDSEAETFIDIISQIRLKPMLPADTIIFPRAKTVINLI
jgi:hypothetical protein